MLNFDPRKWLAEHASHGEGQTVATVASVAATLPDLQKPQPGTNRYEIEKPIFRRQPATVATPATLFGWTHQLAELDPCLPPEGFTMGRWQTLYDDALWLLEGFGAQAAREGWSDADLFGLWPDKPQWGGIADRLGGARSLVMDADRASWRTMGEVDRYARGVYPHLRPLWEQGQ